MERVFVYEAGAELDESERPMDENPKLREEEKYFEPSESNDSRPDTKHFLGQAFMKKLFAKGMTWQKERKKFMDVINTLDLTYEDLVDSGDIMIYQWKEPLPEEFSIVFGFNEVSAVKSINNINRKPRDQKCIIVFNGVELTNSLELVNLQKSGNQIYSLIWLNALNYLEILPLYEATIAIGNLKEESKQNKDEVKKEEKFEKKHEESKKRENELKKENEESKKRENELKKENEESKKRENELKRENEELQRMLNDYFMNKN